MTQIELVAVGGRSEEDWYMKVNGLAAGYLYQTATGWSVGVMTKLGSGPIGPHKVSTTKDAALAFAAANLPR